MALLNIFARYAWIAVILAAVSTTAYEYGQSKAYKKGFDAAWNQQQATIDKMVSVNNASAERQNQKISELEASAAAAYAQVQATELKAATARSDAIAAYKKANPQVAQSCGWSPTTVRAINQILEGSR
jgi:ATPase subunit of ABC transporter with duplicated ATPase domains